MGRGYGTFSRLAQVVALYLLFGVGCAGDGCSCMTSVPGGFPAAERMDNAVQLRVSQTGLDFLSSRADVLAGTLLGDSQEIRFDVPPSCGTDPKVCCYVPYGYCEMKVDLERRAGDSPRFEVDMLDNGRLGLRLRARINTTTAMPVHTQGIFQEIQCWVSVNSTWSGTRHVNLWAELDFEDDPVTGTTRVRVTDTDAWGLTGSDISISGGLLCGFGSTTDAANQVMSQFRNQLSEAVNGFLCQKCESDDECAPFGTCGGDGTCEMDGGGCMQTLGTSGRIAAAGALPNLVTSKAGALDIYLAAGGFARGEQGGLTLGVLGGARPGVGASNHKCVPSVPKPASSNVAESTTIVTNTHPVTGETFDLGLAIHKDYINRAAWAAHQAGFLCVDLGTEQVPLLTANAISLAAPSFIDLVHDNDDPPVYLLVRPQEPPTINLGAGTYTPAEGGGQDIDEPLLTITMPKLEMDFYGYVDGRYTRLLTMVSDLTLTANVDVDGEGKIVPVLGDLANAFQNITVKNSGLLAEAPADIAEKLPALLSIGLPAITDQLKDISLPEMAGFTMMLRPGGLTSIDNNTSLGIFGDLAEATTMERRTTVITSAKIEPRRGKGSVVLVLGGTDFDGSAVDLEWQYRIDHGFWSPYSTSRRITVTRRALVVPGVHTIEVRARKVGAPRTTDIQPMVLEHEVAKTPSPVVVNFHGTSSGDGGCGCSTSGGGSGTGSLLLLLGCVFALTKRRRRNYGFIAVMTACCLVVGCGGGSTGGDEPDATPVPTSIIPGATGRYLSLAADGDRIVVAAYEQEYGDLVLADISGTSGVVAFDVIDGAPDGPAVFEPDGYRGGVRDAGEDVGAWTSTAINAGSVHVAYQDRDRGALILGVETATGWQRHVVDGDSDELTAGEFASMVFDGEGRPAVAYRTVDAAGLVSQLRIAQATTATPTTATDWEITTVEEAELTELPEFHDVPLGTALYVNAVIMPDGQPGIVFYRQTDHSLRLALRDAKAGTWRTVALESSPARDRGQFASATVSGDTLYVAYHDAISHSLFVLQYREGAVATRELVDDGIRADERPHSVGNSIAIVVADDGTIMVAHQNATTANLLMASKPVDGEWSHGGLLSGEIGYGFYTSAAGTAGSLWFATYAYDQSQRVRGHVEAGQMTMP